MNIPYIPHTESDRQEMLRAIGVASISELFADLPQHLRDPVLHLPPPLSELELDREMRALAARNLSVQDYACFLGAGAYQHFIPSVVNHVLARGEFATSYTPYQAEISQGTLQSIFEYQSMICELTGMEVSNAGLYDGASTLAEAALMACRGTGRGRILLLDTVHPHYEAVVRTYVQSQGLEVVSCAAEGLSLDEGDACLVVQHPNFFGALEESAALSEAAHRAGALLVACVDPISLGLLKPPGAYGADIVVGEGQPLGTPLSFGGPYLGVFACRERYVRQMPGRLVGRTTDSQGRGGYVLTLQAREQHIRRERATSNVCTAEALVALAATVYLAALGPQGLRHVAALCYHKAHYAASRIAQLPGYSIALERPFFKEFVVRCPQPPAAINRRLLERRIIGGLDVSYRFPQGMLLCVTEVHPREEIDRLVEALAEARDG